MSWTEGCGDATPPEGFTPQSTVAELCARSCAFYIYANVPVPELHSVGADARAGAAA